jgi:hypothetical protein
MLEQHLRLSDWFEKLKSQRTGPVFFIEHGLNIEELSALKQALKSLLLTNPLSHSCWENHPLPLLVVGAEIGYKYHGNGTDFWPLMEKEVGTVLSSHNRQHVRDLYLASAQKYHGACPPKSPWANSFHLIAWPITHSLLPVEFHRPLAATLAKLQGKVFEMGDAELYRAVRKAAGNVSARFETWLADHELVPIIVRHFLGGAGEKTHLDHSILQRILDDLSLDTVAHRNVAIARRIQRSKHPQKIGTISQKDIPVASVMGRFQLQRRDAHFIMEAWFPKLDNRISDPLRKALRFIKYSPRLWNISNRIPSEQLLSGLPFVLTLSSHPEQQKVLFHDLDNLDVATEHRNILEKFTLYIDVPMLFAQSADGLRAKQILGTELSGNQIYWLMTFAEKLRGLDALPFLGKIGPYKCFKCDGSNPLAIEVLQRLGYQVRTSISASFLGAPNLNWVGGVPKFHVGDHLFLVAHQLHPDKTILRMETEEVVLSKGIIRLPVQQGEQAVTLETPDWSRTYKYVGEPPLATNGQPLCSIHLISPEQTAQALLAGQMSLSVAALAPIEGLELIVCIEAAGERVSISVPLGPLPEIVGRESELWHYLLDDKIRAALLLDANPKLHVNVGSIASSVWLLEQRVSPYWWDKNVAAPRLQSELGIIEHGFITAGHPLDKPVSTSNLNDDDAVLLVPLETDPLLLGIHARFSTLCVAPSQINLFHPERLKPRLRRMLKSDMSGAVGVEQLFESYLRWALAESASLTAEIRRRTVTNLLDNWICEVCCGSDWAEQESVLRDTDPNAWQTLRKIFEGTGLGQDSYVSLSQSEESKRVRLAIAEIRRTLPQLVRGDAFKADLDEKDYESLDLACGRAYHQLAAEYIEVGDVGRATEIADGDPGSESAAWDEALTTIRRRIDMYELAEMLLPSDSARYLVSLNYDLMSAEDVTSELVRWSNSAKYALVGNVPEPNLLEVALELWISPERAVRKNWQPALTLLLTDRSIARAIRYVSLRLRDLGN